MVMTKASFFDIDTLIKVDSKVWIVDKSRPNIPLLKISKSDFNLIKNGIFKKQGYKVDYNGETFWLPTNIANQLKVKMKINSTSFANIGISLQEFLNTELIDNMEVDFKMDNILHLKNTPEDIYIISSKKTKNAYQNLVTKLEEKLKEEGLQVKKYYFINDTFYNQSRDERGYKVIRLLLQHLLGYKTEVTKFTDTELQRYDVVNYYDNDPYTKNMPNEVNPILKSLLNQTEDGLKSVIKEDINEYHPILNVNYITENEANKKISQKVDIDYSGLIKTFESFKTYFK
jgi:hypothetical protein